jgi:hypothetical protein
MAVSFDKALGTATANAQTATITTTNAVAVGAHIIVLHGIWRSTAPTGHTCTATGLTFTLAHQIASGDLRVSLWYAYAAAGFASSSAIVVGGNAGTNGILSAASSWLGIDTSGTVTAFGGAAAATAAWSTGSIGANSGDALIGGAWGDGSQRTSTPTSPANERVDANSATTTQSITIVDKLSVAGSDSLAGTWSGTLDHIAIAAGFKAAAGGGVTVKQLSALGVG